MKPNDTLRPLQDFLADNGLEARHLEALAEQGFTIPIIKIDGDAFIPRDEAQELVGKLKVRALIDATSGVRLDLREVR